jgi:hypothetical protein
MRKLNKMHQPVVLLSPPDSYPYNRMLKKPANDP